MVLILHKKSEDQQFLYQTTCGESLDRVVRDIVHLHNTRLKLKRLITVAKELAQYGVAKPPELQGLDDTEALAAEMPKLKVTDVGLQAEMAGPASPDEYTPSAGVVMRKDPSARRCGKAPSDDVASIILKTCEEASQLLSKEQVARGVPLTSAALQEALDKIRGAVMIVYPMGLPEWDPVREVLEDREDLTAFGDAKDVFDADTATLWWAAKELLRDKTVGDFVGRNEKTKIVAKLQKAGAGAPVREPPLDEVGQKNMLAFYHKRQEELKKLQEDEDDAYTNSRWADPRGLKQAFLGIGDVKWRPGGR